MDYVIRDLRGQSDGRPTRCSQREFSDNGPFMLRNSGFKGQKFKSCTPCTSYISKPISILKSISEQLLLRILLLTYFFAKRPR